MMLNKYDRLVILQTELQSVHYSNKKRKQGDLVLTIGSGAMWYAAKCQWDRCYLGDVFDDDEYKQAHKESNCRIESLITKLNDWSAGNELEMGNYYGFQFWIIIGQIHYNYFILKSIAKHIGNKPVLVYTKKREKTILELRPDPERVFFDVLTYSGLFDKTKIEVVLIDEKRKSFSVKEKLVNALPVTVIRVLRFLRDKKRLPRCKDNSQSKLLLIGGGYDWFEIAALPKFNKKYCIEMAKPLIGRSVVKRQDKKLSDILNDAITFGDVIVYDLKEIKSAIQQDYRLFTKKKERVHNLMIECKAAVTGVLTYPVDLFYAHMAAKATKKLYVWQHGEKGQTRDYTTMFTELYYATDYLTYASDVTKHYREFVGKRRLNSVHTVGSIGKKVDWQDGDTILYATGKWFGTAVPFLDKSDPDQRLFQAHTTILGYLNSIGTKHPVVFKGNNTPGFNSLPYQYDNIDIEYTKTFTELLRTASVVILDTPATTLVEACSTRVPVFVLGGRSEYLPEFMRPIRQRVAWYETPEELVAGLTDYIENGKYIADVSNDDYQKGFCVQATNDEVCENILQSVN